jgi:hypothetical protein
MDDVVNVGASVKQPSGNVTLGVPRNAVQRWSVSSEDPIALSCAPADPYFGSGTNLLANIERLRTHPDGDLRRALLRNSLFCASRHSLFCLFDNVAVSLIIA